MIYRQYIRITNNVCLDCFVPRNDDTCRRHCEERSNPENNMNNTGKNMKNNSVKTSKEKHGKK